MRAARNNQTRAAAILGITTRCIYNKLRAHGLR
jgi:DNA-binding protein Fis